MYKFNMTSDQKLLVTDNLSIVNVIVRNEFHVSINDYEDLYQEGCFLLCQAAISYDPAIAGFKTYAKKVIKNGLISYCRKQYNNKRHLTNLDISEHEELLSSHSDDLFIQVSARETMQALCECTTNYHGIAGLGIKALKLKILGLRITEIAKLYGVPASHVGAWISRSIQKLQKDSIFLSKIL